MTQRNPMNDRYQGEPPKGQTKKSASSMKPKTKAASSVYVRSAEKTPKEKKEIRKQQRARQAELDRKYYNPPTEEYKKLRRLWWIFLGLAIVLTALGMFVPQFLPNVPGIQWICIVPAYAFIILALWLDFSKIRKVRQAYQLEMMKKHPKEIKRHAKTHSANVHAAEKEAQRAEKLGLGARIGKVFGMKKGKEEKAKEATAAAPSAKENAKASAKEKAEEDAHKSIAQLKAERDAEKKAEKAAERAAKVSEKEAEAK